MNCLCAHCSLSFTARASRVNRAAKRGAPLYCGKRCAGLARRVFKTPEQKRFEKSAYDAVRRIELADRIKSEKAAYFQRTYDPAAAAIKRKERMPLHVEYCRRPEYVAWKAEYDATYRAKRYYGDWWEAFLLVNQIRVEVLTRSSAHEVRQTNGVINKAQERRRSYERTIGRESENCLVGNAERSQGRPDAASAR